MAEQPRQTITGEQLVAGIDAAIKLLDAVRDALKQDLRLRFEISATDAQALAPAVGRASCQPCRD